MRALISTIALLTGCGEVSYIVLEVHADLEPGEATSLDILMLDVPEGDPLLAIEVSLADEEFPIDVVLEPSEVTPLELEEVVTAYGLDTPVARIRTQHDWKRGMITRTVLPPLERLP